MKVTFLHYHDCKLDFGLGIYARVVIVFHDQVSSYDEDGMSISQGVVSSHNLDDLVSELVNEVNSIVRGQHKRLVGQPTLINKKNSKLIPRNGFSKTY